MRLGVIGCGTYGTQMLKCFAAEHRQGRLSLVALAEPHAARRAQASLSFGVPGFETAVGMMDATALDAVAVATPDHLHAPAIELALHRGLHVLTQKPLDVDSATGARLVEGFRKADRVLYVDFHKRFDPAHIRLRNEIRAGNLGRLTYGSAQMEDRIEVPHVWLRDWVAHSSPSWFLGINFYDLVSWLTGLKPVRVLASGQKGALEELGHLGVWDSVQAKVEYEGGFSMNYDLSWSLPSSFPSIVNQGIRIAGTGGLVEIDSQQRGYFSATTQAPTAIEANPFGGLEYDHPLFGRVADGYVFRSMTYFIDVLNAYAQGKTIDEMTGYFPDGRSAIVSIRIAEAVDRSLKSGRIEDVE